MPNDALAEIVRAQLQASEYSAIPPRKLPIGQPRKAEQIFRELNQERQELPEAIRDREIRNIVVAVKDMRSESPVIEFAATLARQLLANLTIVHVIERGVDYWTDLTLGTCHDYGHDKQAAFELLDEARKSVLPLNAKTEMREGNPATEILALAEMQKADLIVVGTHGPGRLEQLFLGSVAVTIVREAHCPVMVINHRTANEFAFPDHDTMAVPT